MEKNWKIFQGQDCPNCGGNLEVLSECAEQDDTEFEQFFIDGEEVRCCEECGFKSAMTVSDDNEAFVQDGNINEL